MRLARFDRYDLTDGCDPTLAVLLVLASHLHARGVPLVRLTERHRIDLDDDGLFDRVLVLQKKSRHQETRRTIETFKSRYGGSV